MSTCLGLAMNQGDVKRGLDGSEPSRVAGGRGLDVIGRATRGLLRGGGESRSGGDKEAKTTKRGLCTGGPVNSSG